MKTSLRSAVLQRISSDVARADRLTRHRHRRGRPPRRYTVRLTLVAVALAVLLAGAGYGVRQLTTTLRQHSPTRVPSAGHHSASPSPRGSRRPPGEAGQYKVAEQSFKFTEAAGATLGNRILPVLVHYPVTGQSGAGAGAAGAGAFPLVVFAPGYLQCGNVYSNLLAQWASAGYVVAVINFPQTNCQAANPNENDLIHQPQDVAAVIGLLDRLSKHSHGPLAHL